MATIIFSLVSVTLLLILTGGDKIVLRVLRFILTCVFAFFLMREANWARLCVGLFSLLGVITSMLGFFGLVGAGGSMFSILGIWMIVMAAFSGWVGYMLLLDKDVVSHFSPKSGF